MPYSLKFCNINSVELVNLDVFSNGDLIAELSVDNINFIENAATNTSNILVRIDHYTGAIVWWKSYFFSGYNFQFTSLSMKVENDIVWTINASLDPNSKIKSGVIISYDINGGIVDSYSIFNRELNAAINFTSGLFLEDNSYIATFYNYGYLSG